jgi:TRAP-type C4-dicarboxylate transport system permease small subunit
VLVFGGWVLLIARKRPVPVDLLDMAVPQTFRTLMLVVAANLAPLAALDFLPIEGLPLRWVLLSACF